MELKHFASLIASGSTNTAKNTLSYLIGNGLVNSNWSKALAELYKSFPEDITTTVDSKKEFFPIILKYFTIYQLTNDNIDMYKNYENLFSAKHKDDLKKFNPQWKWDEEPEITFKNALAFTSALPNGYKEKRFDFINQYEKQLSEFMNKSKDKIIKHFTTRRVWDGLMKEDYYKFIEFCDKYQLDRIAILKENINSYTNLYDNQIFEQEGLNFYLEDLTKVGKENLTIIRDFYPNSDYSGLKRSNSCNVMSVFRDCIGNKQYKSAMKWLTVFESEISNYTQLYGIENINTSVNLKNLLNTQLKMIKHERRSEYIEPYFLEKILDNNELFKFMDSYELFENLNEKLLPKFKTKAIKI